MVRCRMQLEILFVIVVLLPIVAAWRTWVSKDHASLNGTRKVMFLVGLVGASVALTIYTAFVIYTFRIHGFGTNFPGMLRWARPGLWISLAALVLSATGTGKSRVWSVAASALVLILWVIPVWGM
jgi:hypothetical protein